MLYIVPTPIGNLEDITLRALRILKEVDLILAEDTRTSAVLLKHYQIPTPLQAFHIHNEHQILPFYLQQLALGKKIALISDAGTPGIADPGFLLIRGAIAQNTPLEVLPGPCALITALVASGLPTEAFVFEGFLPHKKGKLTQIQSFAQQPKTIVFYESPHRILKTLELLATHLDPQRKIVLARELTKKFEQIFRGTLTEVLAQVKEKPPKGEMVLILEGAG